MTLNDFELLILLASSSQVLGLEQLYYHTVIVLSALVLNGAGDRA